MGDGIKDPVLLTFCSCLFFVFLLCSRKLHFFEIPYPTESDMKRSLPDLTRCLNLLRYQSGCCYETGFCIEFITFCAIFETIHGMDEALI